MDSVLVVEDDPHSLTALLTTLDIPGEREVYASTGGLEAVQIAKQARPDLVLLDLGLPDIGGFDVIRQLGEDSRTENIPVIILSGEDGWETVVESFDQGAIDFIKKPYHLGEVRARVETQLRLRNLERKLTADHDRMRGQLHAAQKVQEEQLPSDFDAPQGYQMTYAYRPAEELGGDMLDFLPLTPTHTGMYVLDVSHHGPASALLACSVSHSLFPKRNFTSVVNSTSVVSRPGEVEIRRERLQPASPNDVVQMLDEHYPFNEVTSQYFTIIYGVLEHATGRFTYCNAGHSPGVLVSDSGLTFLESDRPMIGCPIEGEVTPTQSVTLAEGDRLFLFSDGAFEAFDSQQSMFGKERLYEWLTDRSLDLESVVQGASESVRAWCYPRPCQDDFTLAAVERLASV